jgi:hypothetical protein
MALNINGRMKVKTLRADFKKEFGLALRVYDGRSFADDNATLASIRKGDSVGGEFSPQRNTKVGNLENKIMDMFGIKTQVAGSDDSYLCDNDYTLAKALEADEKLMVKRGKRQLREKDDIKTVNPSSANADINKKYYEVEIIGNGGEYTAGIISDRKEIDYLTDRAALGELDLLNENPDYDDNDKDGISELSCLDKDDILHSYGVNCEDDFAVVVRELKSKDSIEYVSDESIWEGTNYEVPTARLYNPNYFLDEPKIKHGNDALILTASCYEKNMTMKYLIETSSSNFGCLVFGTTLMDEMMNGISDEIIDNVYYLEKERLRIFLNEQLENADNQDKEAYEDAIEQYNDLEFDDEDVCKFMASLMENLFTALIDSRELDSGHHAAMSWVFKPFLLEKLDTTPGESTQIEVSLKNLDGNRLDEDDFVDDDIFEDLD